MRPPAGASRRFGGAARRPQAMSGPRRGPAPGSIVGRGLGRVLQRLVPRRHAAQEPPLADRRLSVPPPDLDLEVGAARERTRVEAASLRADAQRRPDEPDERPLWVRRLEEWAPAPTRVPDAPVGFDDGWDPPSAGSQPDSR